MNQSDAYSSTKNTGTSFIKLAENVPHHLFKDFVCFVKIMEDFWCGKMKYKISVHETYLNLQLPVYRQKNNKRIGREKIRRKYPMGDVITLLEMHTWTAGLRISSREEST